MLHLYAFICEYLEFEWILDFEYKLLGTGQGCTNLYTHGNGCNGWKGISLEECQAHCSNNDMPPGCTPSQVECSFIHYTARTYGKWCHLAEANCGAKQADSNLYQKIGKLIFFRLYSILIYFWDIAVEDKKVVLTSHIKDRKYKKFQQRFSKFESYLISIHAFHIYKTRNNIHLNDNTIHTFYIHVVLVIQIDKKNLRYSNPRS